MRKAQGYSLPVIGVVIVGLFAALVLGWAFVDKSGVFTSTAQLQKTTQEIKLCSSITEKAIKQERPFIDTDKDGLADYCDPCPNNKYSKEKDTDNDGLSEVGFDKSGSDQYLDGKEGYYVNKCDSEIRKGGKPSCFFGIDPVRKKCRCQYLFVEERCATESEYKKLVQERKEDVLKVFLIKYFEDGINGILFDRYLEEKKVVEQQLIKEGVIKEMPKFLETVEKMYQIKKSISRNIYTGEKRLSKSQIQELEDISNTDYDTSAYHPDFNHVMKGYAQYIIHSNYEYKDFMNRLISYEKSMDRLSKVKDKKLNNGYESLFIPHLIDYMINEGVAYKGKLFWIVPYGVYPDSPKSRVSDYKIILKDGIVFSVPATPKQILVSQDNKIVVFDKEYEVFTKGRETLVDEIKGYCGKTGIDFCEEGFVFKSRDDIVELYVPKVLTVQESKDMLKEANDLIAKGEKEKGTSHSNLAYQQAIKKYVFLLQRMGKDDSVRSYYRSPSLTSLENIGKYFPFAGFPITDSYIGELKTFLELYPLTVTDSKLITESKKTLSIIYALTGEFEKAKEIKDTLPREIPSELSQAQINEIKKKAEGFVKRQRDDGGKFDQYRAALREYHFILQTIIQEPKKHSYYETEAISAMDGIYVVLSKMYPNKPKDELNKIIYVTSWYVQQPGSLGYRASEYYQTFEKIEEGKFEKP